MADIPLSIVFNEVGDTLAEAEDRLARLPSISHALSYELQVESIEHLLSKSRILLLLVLQGEWILRSGVRVTVEENETYHRLRKRCEEIEKTIEAD